MPRNSPRIPTSGIRPSITWESHPGPQTYMFTTDAELFLYGGAKGGGKTQAMLVLLGGTDTDKDGYKAILFRRTFPELERHIIPESFKLFNGVGEYQTKQHRWRFRTAMGGGNRVNMSGEAFLEFAFLEKENDVYKYSGSEYARIGFDESTMFSENQVRTMISCMRSPVPGILRQCALGSNPVGPGYGWHRQLFFDNRIPFTEYEDAVWPSDKRPVGLRTCFIPARVWDNPTLLKNDPSYPKRLQSQTLAVARALLEGSWSETIYLALDFDEFVHTIPYFSLPEYCVNVIGIDWGKRDKAVAVWLAADDKFVYPYRDYATKEKDIVPFAYEIVNRCKVPGKSELEKIDYIVLSHECFNDKGMGETQADHFRKVFDEFGWSLLKSDKDPQGRLTLIRDYLRTSSVAVQGGVSMRDYKYWSDRFMREGAKAFEEYARLTQKVYEPRELPKMKIFRPTEDKRFGCPELIQTLPLLTTDVINVKELLPGQDDHGYDALGYGLKGLISYGGMAAVPPEAYYARILGGKVPETGMQVELAMEAAKQAAEHGGEEGIAPVEWGTEKYKRTDEDF